MAVTFEQLRNRMAAWLRISETAITPRTRFRDLLQSARQVSVEDEPGPAESQVAGLSLDSLDRIEVIMALEEFIDEAFDLTLEFSEPEAERLLRLWSDRETTVQQLLEFI